MSAERRKRNKPGRLPLALDMPAAEPDRPEWSPIAALQAQLSELEGEQKTKLQEFIFNKQRVLGSDPKPKDFERLVRLAQGAGRDVYKVRHLHTDLILAQKVIHLDSHPETQQQVLRETRLLHECHCQEIVCFFGSFFTPSSNDVNLLMEFMDAGCLDDVMGRVGRLPEAIIAYSTRNILRALSFLASKHKVIHRDLKPSNMLVNTDGDVKLCDFGVSRKLESQAAKTFVGTMRYMSPERIQGKEYDIKSDIWSLGVALIEMATGVYPIPVKEKPEVVPLRDPDQPQPKSKGEAKMAIFDMVANVVNSEPPKLPDGLFSKHFQDFVAICLHKDVKQRADLRTLLEHPWITRCTVTREYVAKYILQTLPRARRDVLLQEKQLDSDGGDIEEETVSGNERVRETKSAQV
eukprot:m.37993 g.37993  ORF g.37993 m.37993 type:complete len:407 (+) comp11144_c1_seq2:242-1462(+)